MAAYLGTEVNGHWLVEVVGRTSGLYQHLPLIHPQQVTRVQALSGILVGKPRLTRHFLYVLRLSCQAWVISRTSNLEEEGKNPFSLPDSSNQV